MNINLPANQTKVSSAVYEAFDPYHVYILHQLGERSWDLSKHGYTLTNCKF